MSRDGVLDTCVVEAFEQLAFLPVEPVNETTSSFDGVAIRVALRGEAEREFVLCLPESLLVDLVDMASGGILDSSDAEAQVDILAELANIVAGRYQAEQSEEVCIGLPEASPMDEIRMQLFEFTTDDTAFWAGVGLRAAS